MPNIQDLNFNKNVSMVYVEENGFTGYKGFDFTKIDSVEDLLRQGVVVSGSLADSAYISGIKVNTDDIETIVQNIDISANNIEASAGSINNKLFITGDPYPAGVQGTIVFQADLSQQFDAVTNFPEQSTGINNYSIGTSNTKVLNYNQYRRELFIQNLATGQLYVKYGSSAASDSSFNFVLAGASFQDAGDGGSLSDQAYIGDVNVHSVTTPRYIAWERTNINKTPLT